ncbi:MAG: NUDIX hydrolase [Ruminococcus sp.]|jgi:ADP-ribose pyrophosphatase|nr:NUDIX hydrolase [Ruminococcus sp.]
MIKKEITISEEVIYSGRIITVRRDIADLDGKEVDRELVLHSGGVCVIALTDKNEVIMVKQYRYPFSEVLLEVPAGKLEPGEDHRFAALRELREETGAVPEHFEYLGVIYPTVAYLNEKIHIYLATGLTFTKTDFDEDEYIDIEKMPLETAVKMVMSNEIKDAKTIAAVLMAKVKKG